MIKKLRLRFILISMLATFLVLFAIVGGINVNNYVKINRSAERTLGLIKENGGKFPSAPDKPNGETDTTPPDKPDNKDSSSDKENKPSVSPADKNEFSPEAPFETRYFTVVFSSDGEITETYTDNIAAISDDTAKSLAEKFYKKNKSSGMSGSYKFISYKTENSGTAYVFLDVSRDLNNFRSFLSASLIISSAGFIIVSVLIGVFSGAAIKPVAESYSKQKRFITDAGHEIKTPLTVISADTELIELESGKSEWTTAIKDQIKNLTDLVNKLVLLSRMDESDYIGGKVSEFSLSEVAADVVKTYKNIFDTRGKKLSADIEANVSVTGNVKYVKELLTILLDNAAKYTNAGGEATLTLKGGRSKKLIIENTVESVKKGDLSEFFERFYRADESRNSETGGHGIGLSIAKEIADKSGLKITANSPDGKSVVFTVNF